MFCHELLCICQTEFHIGAVLQVNMSISLGPQTTFSAALASICWFSADGAIGSTLRAIGPAGAVIAANSFRNQPYLAK